MDKYLKWILLLLFPVLGWAQNPLFREITKAQSDSLKLLLKTSINDTIRMAANRDLCYYYQDINWDSSMIYGDQRLMLAKQLKLKLWEAEGYDMLGYNLVYFRDYANSLKAYMEGFKLAQDKESEKNIWRISQFSTEGDPHKARLNVLASITQDIGHLFGRTGDKRKQLSQYFETAKIAESIDDITILSAANNNIGNIYFHLNQLDSSLLFLNKGIKYANSSGFKKNNGGIYTIIGDIYLKKINFDSALYYYKKALNTDIEQNMVTSLCLDFNALSGVYLKYNQVDSGLYYAQKAIAASKYGDSPSNLLYSYKNLAFCYESKKQIDSALYYQKLIPPLMDSLNSVEQENFKKYQAIGFDEKMKLQQLEQEKIEEQSKVRIYAMLAGLVFFLLIAIILYRNNYQKEKAKKVLEITLDDLKTTQSQLLAQKELAEASEAFKSRFLANMSHEIRTPLHGIAGFTDLLLDTSLSEKQRRWLSAVQHSTDRLSEVVNNILDLSKLEAGEMKLRQIAFAPTQVLEDVQDVLSLRAENKGITLELKIDPNVPPAVLGDPTRLYQIILNLAGNAVKFTEKGGVLIQVDAMAGDGLTEGRPITTLTFTIKDTGIGIPADKLSTIFGSFQQVGEDTAARFGGTGLGLTIARELVQLYGSDIQVKSEQGKGSSFAFTLDLPQAEIKDLNRYQNNNNPLLFEQPLRILLADDRALNLEIATESIRRHFVNAEIVEAQTGKAVIDLFQQQVFDLILMDIQMPEMTGIEAAKYIRRHLQSDIPIIALTASSTPEEIENALASGMNRHLGKPFKPHELAEVIMNVLALDESKPVTRKSNESDKSDFPVTTALERFDLRFLRDFTDGDEVQMQYFIQKFLAQYPVELKRLDDALTMEDYPAFIQAAHSFRPQLEFVGLHAEAALALQLENSVRAQQDKAFISGILVQLKGLLEGFSQPNVNDTLR